MPGVVGPTWHPGRSGLPGWARVRSRTAVAAAARPSATPATTRTSLRTTRVPRRGIGYSCAISLLRVVALVRKPRGHGRLGALADLDGERPGAERGMPGLERV